MPDVRTLLRPVAVALLLAAGGLLVWPAPAAPACQPGPPPPPAPLPADAVVFEGTLLGDAQVVPGVRGTTTEGVVLARTFAVGRVLHGSVGLRAVIVDPHAGATCFGLRYAQGRTERASASDCTFAATRRCWLGRTRSAATAASFSAVTGCRLTLRAG
jgi:hypothetical protein